MIIERTDFTGRYSIPQNALSNADIDLYIAKYEVAYLQDLLGVAMFEEFEADFGLPSMPARFSYIEDAFAYDEDTDGCIVRSEGMLEMLKGFLYFHIVRDMKYKNSITGIGASNSEIAREVTFDEANIYGRYNDAIATYEAIQRYIDDNSDEYPEYNGKPKTIAHWSL